MRDGGTAGGTTGTAPEGPLACAWERAKLKSTLLRKGEAVAMQVPRRLARYRATALDYRRLPPILANSFPKSGTHLLLQIVRAWTPRYYGSFIASMPSVTFRERSLKAHLRRIARIVPGEAVPGHLFYAPAHAQALAARNVVHFFIHRDLQEVAASEAHYLTYMTRWHRLHPYFARRLKTDEERLACALGGIRDLGSGHDYPAIEERFRRYQGWLGRADVLAIRYEDLMGARRLATIGAMADFYRARAPDAPPREALIELAAGSIAPERSHTFSHRRAEPAGQGRQKHRLLDDPAGR